MITSARLIAVLAVIALLGTTVLDAQINSTVQRQGGIPLRRGPMVNSGALPSLSIAKQAQGAMLAGVRRLVPSQYATIQAAIDSAKNGDTVLVSENRYVENIRFRGKGIIVASLFLLDGDTSHVRKTVIDGSGATNPDSGSVVSFVNGEDTTSVLCGFTVTGGTGTMVSKFTSLEGGGVLCHESGARLRNNIITGNILHDNLDRYGLFGAGVAAEGTATQVLLMEGNVVTANGGTSNANSTGGGGIGAYSANIILRKNIVTDNVFSTQTTIGWAAGGGVYAEQGSLLADGNVIARNKALCPVVIGSYMGSGGGVYCEAVTLDFRKNRVIGNTTQSSGYKRAVGGGLVVFADNLSEHRSCSIEGNYFSLNQALGGPTASGGGIDLFNEGAVVQNNIIVRNRASVGGGIGIHGSAYGNALLINNTIAFNSTADLGSGGGMCCDGSGWNPIVLNTIVWGDTGAQEIGLLNGSQIRVRYSAISDGYAGLGNINSTPLFSDTTFRLGDGSLCLGRGRDSLQIDGFWYQAPRQDIYGSTRPSPAGSFPDIGAAESPLRETRSRTVPGQYATIQAAIDAAAHGDTVLVSENTYKENIRFRGKRITVASLYLVDRDTTHIAKTIIDGSASTNVDSGSVVSFVNGEDTTSVLCGFTIQGGTGTNMIYTTGGVSYGARSGGGVFCNMSGARITRNTIRRNRIIASFPTGGGVEIYGSPSVTPTMILENNRITDNYIGTNAAYWVYAGGADFTGAMGRILNNTFERDTASGGYGSIGGGMSFTFYDGTSPLVSALIKGNIFRANLCAAGSQGAVGGGLFVGGTSDMTIADNIFDRNTAYATAGWAEGGAVGVDDEGMTSYGRKLILRNTFMNNSVGCTGTNVGGGLDLYKTLATVGGNLFEGNSVTGLGTGFSNTPGGGGAISAFRSSFRVENNIIRKNKSAKDAGGLLITYPPQVGTEQLIVNNTITGNQVDGVGGAMRVYSASGTVLLNSICWKDSGRAGGNEIAEDGGFAAVANCDIRGGWPSGTSIISSDPMFVDSTKLDLSPSSKCIGHGADSLQVGGIWYKAPRTDFYGNVRPMPLNTRTDIGAVEELITDVPGVTASVPVTYALDQNYPNPFNPSTVVSIQLPVASKVRLVVYNLLGQQVAVLMDEKKEPGSYLVRWNAAGMPSGVYFYRLEAGEFKDVKKMVLLK